MMIDKDYVFCECNLEQLQQWVEHHLEPHLEIKITKEPSTCLTMIKAEDSVEKQPFYLGEALTTECEVIINNQIGYGICLGDEPIRAYCLALVDALLVDSNQFTETIEAFIQQQYQSIQLKEQREHHHIMQTKVDFKMMDQA